MVILNEIEYAEKCLNTNTMDAPTFQTLAILAKYYYHHKGIKPKQIRENLKDFLAKSWLEYAGDSSTRIRWDEIIEKIVLKVKKYKLYQLDPIPITRKELNTIKSIGNIKAEKLAFSLLCYAKLTNSRAGKESDWANPKPSELKKTSKVGGNDKEFNLIINSLYRKGLVEFPKSNGLLSVKVLFVDHEENTKPVLLISDYRCLGYEYVKYIGQPYRKCKNCGILFRYKDKRNKKCKSCIEGERVLSRLLTCEDCGKTMIIPAANKRTTRCPECYTYYRRYKKIVAQRERRAKEKGGRKQHENR